MLDAIIFDMDGTLVDNMRHHIRAWLLFCERHGLKADAETFERRMAGKKNEEILPEIFGRALPPAEIQAFAHEKEATYRELYRPELKALPGALELLQRLEREGTPCLVASAAPVENRALVLDGLDLRRYFKKVVGAEDAKRGKPSPDIFLAAASAVGASPAKCLVFEDAVNGVLAAKAAGMRCVGVETCTDAAALREAGAQLVVKDFRSLPADLFGP